MHPRSSRHVKEKGRCGPLTRMGPFGDAARGATDGRRLASGDDDPDAIESDEAARGASFARHNRQVSSRIYSSRTGTDETRGGSSSSGLSWGGRFTLSFLPEPRRTADAHDRPAHGVGATSLLLLLLVLLVPPRPRAPRCGGGPIHDPRERGRERPPRRRLRDDSVMKEKD